MKNSYRLKKKVSYEDNDFRERTKEFVLARILTKKVTEIKPEYILEHHLLLR